jgi:hypothetical protein
MGRNEMANGYIVIGSESSGTRLFTKICIHAGCLGSDQHDQVWDYNPFPAPNKPIVFRRSVPHNKVWPDVKDIIKRMQDSGYEVMILITTRDWHATMKSQVSAHHVSSEELALKQIRRAYKHIFSEISSLNIPYVLGSYESITSNPKAVSQLLKELELPQIEEKKLGEIGLYNGNTKWFS